MTGAVFTIWISHRYFRQQALECEKYPFFKLRDEIVLEIALSDNPKNLESLYSRVNAVIQQLKIFDLSFFSDAAALSMQRHLERGLACNFNQAKLEEIRKEFSDIPDIERRFFHLILDTAKQNSLLLSLCMSKFGYKMFLSFNAFHGLIRFLKAHPEIFKKKEVETVRVAETYCILNAALAAA